MTNPSVDTALSGSAVDAVRTLQAELSSDYSEMRSAEIQLTEALLTAHAVTVSGRSRLQDIQRQLIEAINNPVAALGTPAGERHFLLFLRSKIAEIQDIVDTGALTDEDHAQLTRALGNGYLLPTSEAQDAPPSLAGGAPATDQAAGMLPTIGSALGSLPQAAQGAAAVPAQAASGLAGALSPLAGLASGLVERAGESGESGVPEDRVPHQAEPDEDLHIDKADEDEDDDRPSAPQPPSEGEPPESGPAQTRPAGSR